MVRTVDAKRTVLLLDLEQSLHTLSNTGGSFECAPLRMTEQSHAKSDDNEDQQTDLID